MKIVVPNQSVRKNIELFKGLVARQAQKSLSKEDPDHIYEAFINCKTGDLFFPEFSEKKDPPKKDWKQIVLYIKKDSKGKKVELVKTREKDRMQDAASAILQETLHVLNFVLHKTREVMQTSSLEEGFKQIQMEEVLSRYACADLIYEAWHNIDRLQAEKLLERYSPGAFFFRKDEYCKRLEEGIGHKCFTLTYLKKSGQVIDRTIVQKGKSFLFYDGDLHLRGNLYETIDMLLDFLQGEVLFPIFSFQTSSLEKQLDSI